MAENTKIDPLILAYLAGIVDADGYITINRSKRKGVLYHGAVVGISGTQPEPHELASSLWGGKVYRYEPKNPSYRPQYQWSRQGDGAVPVIEALFPFLRIKSENAILALELQQHAKDGRGDDPFPWFGPDYDPIAHREKLRSEMVETLSVRKSPRRLLDGVEHNGMPVS